MPWAPVLLKSCRTLSTWGPGSTQRPLVLGRHDDIWPSVQGVACQSPWGAAAAEGTCLPHADSTALSTHCVRAPGWLPPCWLRTASYFCRSARTAGDRELLSFRPEDPRPRRAPRPPTSVVCSKSSHCSLRGEAPMSRLPGPLTSATGRWRRTHRSESGGHAACTSAVPAGSPPRLCFQMPSDPPRAHTHGCRGERQDLHG